jgi:hypothetical protein
VPQLRFHAVPVWARSSLRVPVLRFSAPQLPLRFPARPQLRPVPRDSLPLKLEKNHCGNRFF